jgi:tRNA(Ile)-lysidine synthase
LGFAKAELEKICTDGGINPVHDPSNNDADFDRVAMRQFLGRHPHPFDPSRAARTASALAETADALEWMTTQLGLERVTSVGGAVEISINDLPRELQRRLVIAGLQKLVPEINPRGEAIERLLDNLNTGKTAMIGDILCKGGDVCHFSPAPRRRTG